MAKQVVGPIEQHVEKAVLALAGIGLIAVIAMYLVTSPNQIELDGQPVTAPSIDQKLLAKTNDMRQRIRSGSADEEKYEPQAGKFVEGQNPFPDSRASTGLVAAVSFYPEVPIIDPPGITGGNVKLVEVQQLPKPSVTFGRSSFVLRDGATDQYVPLNWVTVSAVFDRTAQKKLQADAYGAQRSGVVFGPVEMQRRARRPDGTWSDDDWELVRNWPAARLSEAPPVVIEHDDNNQLFVPREGRTAIEGYQNEVGDPPLQLDLIRPLMPEVFRGAPWAFPELVPFIEVLKMDDDFLHAAEVDRTPDNNLENRYGIEKVGAPEAEPEKVLTPTEEMELLIEEGLRFMDLARKNRSDDQAIEAFNRFITVKLSKDAGPSQKSRAQRLAAEAEQLARDIARDKVRRGGAQTRPGVAEGEVKERELWPRQLLWVHDALQGSVGSGKVYQYRIRAMVFNRLVGEPDRFKNPDDARVFFIPGEWSEPSDPIAIEPTHEYFVTGVDERDKKVKVELYQWFDGYWVTTRRSFGVGERVQCSVRVGLPAWDNPTEVDRPMVDFDAGTTVAAIDLRRPVRERRMRGGAVRLQPDLAEDCSVLFVNSVGVLEERFVSEDKASPDKKSRSSVVWRPTGGR
ncbi:MAG: hypothetical protein KJ749_03385 [Planctomycetes bacterium]|nr:hypothetical protein [Planctomycetota bacterium]